MKESGVVLQNNGKFDEHIQLKVGKAFQTCGGCIARLSPEIVPQC
jgi:hypothetical protein